MRWLTTWINRNRIFSGSISTITFGALTMILFPELYAAPVIIVSCAVAIATLAKVADLRGNDNAVLIARIDGLEKNALTDTRNNGQLQQKIARFTATQGRLLERNNNLQEQDDEHTQSLIKRRVDTQHTQTSPQHASPSTSSHSSPSIEDMLQQRLTSCADLSGQISHLRQRTGSHIQQQTQQNSPSHPFFPAPTDVDLEEFRNNASRQIESSSEEEFSMLDHSA